MNFSGQFSRVAAGVIIGETPREFLWRLAVVAIILGHQVLQTPFTTVEFFVSAAAAIALSIVLQQILVARVLPRAVTAAEAGIRHRRLDPALVQDVGVGDARHHRASISRWSRSGCSSGRRSAASTSSRRASPTCSR